jgi:F-type H+-transporting ATPase subunit b
MADTSTLPVILAQDATGTAPADSTTGTPAPADATTGTPAPADATAPATGTAAPADAGTAAPADATGATAPADAGTAAPAEAGTTAPADGGTAAPAETGAAAPADATGTAAPAASTDAAAPAGGDAAPATDAAHDGEVAPGADTHATPDAAHATTEHESSAGMPQLDPATFEPQLVWLGITFILLLVLMWGVALPRIRRILEARDRKVSDDLDRAEQVKKEADAVLAAYNRSISEARAKAQEAMRAATAEAAAVVSERETAFGASLKERLDQAQSSIEAAKVSALRDLKSVATDVAAATTAKLGGGELPRERVAAVVEQAMARQSSATAEA